jgi:Holliday junction resolvasome RuvABC DNA-binding subunit
MSVKTLTPEEQLLKTTREKLSKYGSPQLLSKLRSGAFLKMSKDVAIAILEKRGEDVSEFKVSKGGVESVETTPKTEPSTKKGKELVEKVAKAPKAVKEKVITSTFVAIDETLPEIDKIINSRIEMSKTDKIKALLNLGYTPNQISKTTLNARYAMCFTVKSKMEKANKPEA